MPRANAGFTIIDSIFVGDSEFVLGVSNANPAMYVTWKCADRTNYNWGHYHTDQIAAKRDLLKRAGEELDYVVQQMGQRKFQLDIER